jgi:CxxC motif-containing protein (DUF1111 family)
MQGRAESGMPMSSSKVVARIVFFGAIAGAIVIPFVASTVNNIQAPQSTTSAPGGPIAGLTLEQKRKFDECEVQFRKEFTPEEGLGPLFNGKSCFECHGQPEAAGGEGRDVAGTGVVRIGGLNPNSPMAKKPIKEIIADTTDMDVHGFLMKGGPALERKSITSEFPAKYPADAQVELGTIPPHCDFISMRHAGPLFGFGLIDSIDDADITANIFKEIDKNPKMAGRALSEDDPMAKTFRVGRFGWKCQRPNLMLFSAEAMDVEMGLTTPVILHPKSATGISEFPHKIVAMLPSEPNDPDGKLMTQFAYFQDMIAPPPRGEITDAVKRGEKVFDKLQCSVCHIPEMKTKQSVYLADPDSNFPKLNYIEVQALENKPVKAYSDFLVHNMGVELADGLPQAGATGGEWRTTPLWGLRFKKFLLHDGRTHDLTKVIALHGGQGDESRKAFDKLPQKDKDDLISFLRSL